VVLLFGLRLMGKRELGQMTAFDLVVILIISNGVQNAMVGPGHLAYRRDRGGRDLLPVVNRLVAWARLRVPLFGELGRGSSHGADPSFHVSSSPRPLTTPWP
jgi:hypothetical protein